MENTNGAWGLWYPTEPMCCPEVEVNSDIILWYVRRKQRGTLRRMLYGLFRKGVSLRGSTVYIARINKQGELRDARPCQECWKKLKRAGVKAVFYSINLGTWIKEYL